jgi:hypothetical protein
LKNCKIPTCQHRSDDALLRPRRTHNLNCPKSSKISSKQYRGQAAELPEADMLRPVQISNLHSQLHSQLDSQLRESHRPWRRLLNLTYCLLPATKIAYQSPPSARESAIREKLSGETPCTELN